MNSLILWSVFNQGCLWDCLGKKEFFIDIFYVFQYCCRVVALKGLKYRVREVTDAHLKML